VSGPARILVFQNRFLIGGQERQAALLVRTMDRSRFEPVVACLHLEGEHLAELRATGVEPVLFDVGRRMLRVGTAWQVGRLARFIRERGIALVHAQDAYTDVLGTLAARLAGVPSIATRVDLGHHLTGYRRPLVRVALQGADRVLVNALCIRNEVIRDGVEADRVVVVRNGVDVEALERQAAVAPAEEVPPDAVVCVANMHHPVKGQTELLLAMREVAREHPAARLVLVGDGIRRPLLERAARQLGIAERCRFAGFRLDGASIVARAAVAVSASHAEGLSNSILEALALRRPVVATAVGGTPELVRDGVNGRLVPPGAPAALAARILDLLRDPGARRRMGERGRRIVEREFSLRQMQLGYEAVYEDLVGLRLPRLIAGMG
jgi:glycosyltransferase involved in cell wall biosynthesis